MEVDQLFANKVPSRCPNSCITDPSSRLLLHQPWYSASCVVGCGRSGCSEHHATTVVGTYGGLIAAGTRHILSQVAKVHPRVVSGPNEGTVTFLVLSQLRSALPVRYECRESPT